MVEVVSVLESEQRLDDGDNPLGLLFRVEQFGKLNAGFDMISVGLDDFFEDLCRAASCLTERVRHHRSTSKLPEPSQGVTQSA